MKSKIMLARKIARLIYNYMLILFFVTFLIYIIRRDSMDIKEYLVLAAAMIVSYVSRDKTGNNIVLFIIHVIMIMASVSVQDDVPEMIVIGLAVFVIKISAMKYNKNDGKLRRMEEIPWQMFVAGMIMYAFGLYINNKEMMFSAYLIPVLLFITYLVVLYIDGIYFYIERTKDVTDLPVRRMMSVNSTIVAGIILIIIISLVISYVFKLDTLMKSFFKGVLAVVRIVLLGINFIFTLIMSMLSSGTVSDEVEKKGEQFDAIIEDNNVGDSMMFVVTAVMILLAAVVVIYAVRKIIRFIVAKRNMPQDIVEEITATSHDEKEKRKGFMTVMKERMSVEERTRRVYRDTILRTGRPYIPYEMDTTLDIESVIDDNSVYNVEEITELYNRVRYSDMTTDRKILSEMKRRARRVRS